MIKHILVPASGLGFDANLLTDAFKLASPFSAHVDVLHMRWEPRRDLPFYGEGFPLEMLDTLMHETELSAQQVSSALRSSRQTSRVARGHAFALAVKREGRAVGEALAATAMEMNVGLLVMGGYGHSRLREIVPGGATRRMRNHQIDFPVLLAH